MKLQSNDKFELQTERAYTSLDAITWTDQGLDYPEAMMDRAQFLCIRPPPSAKQGLFLINSLKILVIVLLAGGAIPVLLVGTHGFGGYALNSIFIFLAIIGLLRLPAALWLTDDYVFKEGEQAVELVSTLEALQGPAAVTGVQSTLARKGRGIGVRLFYILFFVAGVAACVIPSLPAKLFDRTSIAPSLPVAYSLIRLFYLS